MGEGRSNQNEGRDKWSNREMKKKNMIILFSIFLIVLAAVIYFICSHYVFTSFATKITMTYIYGDKNIVDMEITDKNDIAELKQILRGISYTENPSCGFSEDISITFTNGEKKIMFCPACDSCGAIRINNSDKYIWIDKKKIREYRE